MSATAIMPKSQVSASDRLGMALFMAAALHGIIILGVGFSKIIEREPDAKLLDVILVNKKTKAAPEEADYLAQVNQVGGGNTEDRARPRSPFTSFEENDRDGIAPVPVKASSPRVEKTNKRNRVITQKIAQQKVLEKSKRKTIDKTKPIISTHLVERSMEIARLSEELDESLERYAKRPRKQFISARTKEAVEAAYMHQWITKVERIGNLNYPDAAKRKRLSGTLMLMVAIKSDGSLHDVIVRRASGHQILDDAARRIVSLASPFAPLPEALRKRTDILYITRTWEFKSNSQLSTR